MERQISSQSLWPRPTLGLPSGWLLFIVSILTVSSLSFATAPDFRVQAQEAQKAGDTKKASKILWDHIEQLDRSGFLDLIHWEESSQDWSEVVRAANLAVAKNLGDEEILTALGNAQFQRKKITEAKEALRKAIEANKKYQPAYDVLAKIYEKNTYELRALYSDMIEIFGPKPLFLKKMCSISRQDGDNEQGEQLCNQAIAKDPDEPENHVNLGLIAKQKGEVDRARKILKEAAAKFPNSEMAQVEMGSFFEQEKNFVDAYTSFENGLKANPKSERCMLGIGQNGVQIEKYSAAFDAFKQLCHIAGRANALSVRRATAVVRQGKDESWKVKFESLSESCAIQ